MIYLFNINIKRSFFLDYLLETTNDIIFFTVIPFFKHEEPYHFITIHVIITLSILHKECTFSFIVHLIVPLR